MRQAVEHVPFMIEAIRELDAGIGASLKWLDHFNETLVCDGIAEPSVTDAEAHALCAFGQWLNRPRSGPWTDWEDDLADIEILHRSMHAKARDLYAKRHSHARLPPGEYRDFVDTALHFKTALRSLEFRIINQACLVDHLTGAWNRSAMMQKLSEEYDRMLRNRHECSLCMMDVDHFKAVNDNHGHLAGDQVLLAIVDIAKRRLRPYDAIFRYGGEEFLFCLPNTTTEEAAAAVERIRADLEAEPIDTIGGRVIRVTASFGIAPLARTLSVEECIEIADRTLLFAKARGRNRVCRWDLQ